MWGKKEQFILWLTAYLPLLLIMIYRFIDSNNFLSKSKIIYLISQKINQYFVDFIVIMLIILFSLVLYRVVTKWYFEDLEKDLLAETTGDIFFVRKYENLSVNDYSFFLMTLFIPLISIDHASVINLVLTVLTIGIVILIYVKTDSISVCPLFFTSGKYVYIATISEYSREMEALDPSLRKSVIIITPTKELDLNRKFRVSKLNGDVYYLTNTR
ncbi:hypothetical protein ACFWMP_25715 [Paenibacillus sp. NPDC058367]|uniref:hypothetical protein n=1 Tax=Paenibacillus sp. NPDC058367 TaxID=3346460 RepID=UPI003653C53D